MNASRVRRVALGFGFWVMWARMVRYFRGIGHVRVSRASIISRYR